MELSRAAYIIDERRLRQNLSLLADLQRQAGVHIIMALKAQALWPLFPIIREYLLGATASSLNEALLIRKYLGVRAHVYAPVYFADEFSDLLECSSHIVFNSMTQFQRFGKHALKAGLSIGLRVNPGWSDVKTDKYNPAISGSRLGIDQLELLPDGVEGLHVHALCESNSYSLEKMMEAFKSRFSHLFPSLKWINLGGGHLMTKAGYDHKHLVELLTDFRKKADTDIILEPGAALVWRTGELVAHVEDIVDHGGVRTLMLDVSFTAHMPDCLEMPYNPEVRHADYGNEGKYSYQLGGTTCLAGDYLGPYSFDSEVELGDQIVFEDMIHYTMVKTTMFNGVRHPDIMLRTLDGEVKLLRRFDFNDFERRMG